MIEELENQLRSRIESEFSFTDNELKGEDEKLKFLNQFAPGSWEENSVSFHSDYLAKRFSTNFELSWNSPESLLKFFEREVKQKRFILNRVGERIIDIRSCEDAFLEFYRKNVGYLNECSDAISRLQNGRELSMIQLRMALEKLSVDDVCTFNLKYIRKMLHLFPVAKRHEVISHVIERVLADMRKKVGVPVIQTRLEEVNFELRRLSKFAGIQLNMEEYDGYKFHYMAWKAYDTVVHEATRIDPVANSETPKVNESLQESFSNLLSPNPDFITQETKALGYNEELSHKLVLMSYRYLLFVRIRMLLDKIIDVIKRQQQIADQCLDKSDAATFVSLEIARLQNQFIPVMSAAMENSDGKQIDPESFLERILILELDYQQAKEDLLVVLSVIIDNSEDGCHLPLLKSIIDNSLHFDLIPNIDFISIFELHCNIIRLMTICLHSMVVFYIGERRAITGNYIPQMPNQPSLWQRGDIAVSCFEVFPELANVAEVYYDCKSIALEFVQSLGVRQDLYSEYFLWSVWEELHKVLVASKTKEDARIYDWYVESAKGVKKVSFDLLELGRTLQENQILPFLNVAYLSSKFRSLVSQTNLVLPVYRRQDESFQGNAANRYAEMSFTDVDILIDGVSYMKDVVVAHNNLSLIIIIATRFNNFRDDFYFLKSILTGHKDVAELMLYEAQEILEGSYPSVVCSLRHVSESLTHTTKLRDMFMPFAIRSELEFLSSLERAAYYQNSGISPCSLSKNSIMDTENRISCFQIAKLSESLMLTRTETVLRDMMSFVLIRLRLIMCLIQDEKKDEQSCKQTTLLDHLKLNCGEAGKYCTLNESLSLFRHSLNQEEDSRLFALLKLVWEEKDGSSMNLQMLKDYWRQNNARKKGYYMNWESYIPNVPQLLWGSALIDNHEQLQLSISNILLACAICQLRSRHCPQVKVTRESVICSMEPVFRSDELTELVYSKDVKGSYDILVSRLSDLSESHHVMHDEQKADSQVQEVIVDQKALIHALSSLSSLINEKQHSFGDDMVLSWDNYISNVLRQLRTTWNLEEELNIYVRNIIEHFDRSIDTDFVETYRDQLLLLSRLRDEVHRLKMDSPMIVSQYRQEFDSLLTDLRKCIVTVQSAHHSIHSSNLDAYSRAIEKFLSNSAFFDSCPKPRRIHLKADERKKTEAVEDLRRSKSALSGTTSMISFELIRQRKGKIRVEKVTNGRFDSRLERLKSQDNIAIRRNGSFSIDSTSEQPRNVAIRVSNSKSVKSISAQTTLPGNGLTTAVQEIESDMAECRRREEARKHEARIREEARRKEENSQKEKRELLNNVTEQCLELRDQMVKNRILRAMVSGIQQPKIAKAAKQYADEIHSLNRNLWKMRKNFDIKMRSLSSSQSNESPVGTEEEENPVEYLEKQINEVIENVDSDIRPLLSKLSILFDELESLENITQIVQNNNEQLSGDNENLRRKIQELESTIPQTPKAGLLRDLTNANRKQKNERRVFVPRKTTNP